MQKNQVLVYSTCLTLQVNGDLVDVVSGKEEGKSDRPTECD